MPGSLTGTVLHVPLLVNVPLMRSGAMEISLTLPSCTFCRNSELAKDEPDGATAFVSNLETNRSWASHSPSTIMEYLIHGLHCGSLSSVIFTLLDRQRDV